MFDQIGWRAAVAALAVSALGFAGQATARDLTVVSWGGSYQDAQREVYFEPFKEATGTSLLEDSYNGGLAKIRSMVQTGTVTWDVVQVEAPELIRGCQQGLFEFIPWDKMGDRGNFIDGAATDCGVGTIVWAVALAYNTENVDGTPAGWADFWDVEKFPGKRGLRKGAKFNLEIALMADGVPADRVYEVLATDEGVDRAFNKLDELKPHMQWWEAGAQPPEWLASGDVVMSSAYNGRITAAQKEGQPFKIAWDGQVYAIDSWVIVRGSPKMDEAVEFIRYASQPENQAGLPKAIPYGPTHVAAIEEVPEDVRPDLPTAPQNLENALRNDTEFWIDREESLDERFNSWIAQ
ncbi:ABC transporter substrate-binding protein [Ferruginivarius sediminum]|uniref:ABC transporter substrate-binding protein n=1 Tax=Ferruginivarius sediminum TaxID=2661937 RepID=A0A369TB49_9PROT|nr:ABC transporter substrate-binding protein [Ferruginivarius sediminum]RDD62561.1 ABC transporter substrate-binding protein [Ferruginivarius sediminum]